MTTPKPNVLNNPISRRSFLKASGGLAVGAFLLGDLSPKQIAKRLTAVAGAPSRYVASLCEMCVWRCGLRARIENGKLRKLEGNSDHPHSRGILCPRGQAGVMTAYDPDRIQFPLIRAGDRGSGLFRRASWDGALNTVAEKMLAIKQSAGPEGMVFSSTHNLAQTQFENLMRAYGSPNYGTQRSLCFNAMIMAGIMTYGLEEPGRDYDNAKYIIYAGRNLMEAISNSETQDLVAAISRGVKVVLLDPRFTVTASKSTEWLPVRPGTDLAFFLALLNVIIAEKRYDETFINQYTVGFEDLAKEVTQYTPEWAAPICGIEAERIQRIAREFSDVRPNCFAHPNWRTSNFVNTFQAERAISILNALMGNWGKPGGLVPPAGEEDLKLGQVPQPPYPRVNAARLDGVPNKYPLVPLKIGVFQALRDGILEGQPYQAKGWFVFRQNPVDSIAERKKTLAAISKLDLMVTVDVSMNDTAWYSDVVLPESSYLERYDPLATMGNLAFIRQPVIQPLGESKSALWIFKQLGERLGLKDFFAYADEEDYIRAQLAPLGMALEEMKAKGFYAAQKSEETGEPKWNTPSGKIEIASSVLAKANQAAVPTWQEPPMPAADQFYLLTGKVAQHTQFATQNNKWLNELYPKSHLTIHTQPATKLGIKTGDGVIVESEIGKVEVEAFVTEGIRPDCVFMTQGFGKVSKGLKTAYGKGAADNDLHLSITDPVSGGQALSQTFVKVTKKG